MSETEGPKRLFGERPEALRLTLKPSERPEKHHPCPEERHVLKALNALRNSSSLVKPESQAHLATVAMAHLQMARYYKDGGLYGR